MSTLNQDQVFAALSRRRIPRQAPPLHGATVGDIDFADYIFQDDVDFTGVYFAGTVDFERATFRKSALFTGATFGRVAHFDGARFEGRSAFNKVTFQKDARFAYCRFVDRAYFWRARFNSAADFSQLLVYVGKDSEPDFIYPAEANFSWAWFRGEARFTRAHFHGPAYFWRTLFFSKVMFDEIWFASKVCFNGTPTEVQISRFDFQNPDLLDSLQQEGLLRPDIEEHIVFDNDKTRTRRPVFFLFDAVVSEQQLLEKLHGIKGSTPSHQEIMQLTVMWTNGARPMFSASHLTSFRGVHFEKPCQAEFIDIKENVPGVKVHASVAPKRPRKLLVDFAIITALEVERKAVCKAFGIEDHQRAKTKSGVYWRGRLMLTNEDFYEIVVAQCGGMASVESALITTKTLDQWHPQNALLVGIAAAATKHQSLGDVVVGTDVYYYEKGKMSPEGKRFEPEMYRPDSTLWSNVEGLPDWTTPIHADRPGSRQIRPHVHKGVIASGEKVIADVAVRDELAAGHRKIMAIEMEGYGFSKAVWHRFERVRHLIIRAICDDGTLAKNDQWHSYAAAAAASYAFHFLKDRPLPPRNPAVKPAVIT
jgi:nucleoside phosphorylase